MSIKITPDSKRTDQTKWQTKERLNVQLCKTLTSISPVMHLSNNKYIKNVNNIFKIKFLSEFQTGEGMQQIWQILRSSENSTKCEICNSLT